MTVFSEISVMTGLSARCADEVLLDLAGRCTRKNRREHHFTRNLVARQLVREVVLDVVGADDIRFTPDDVRDDGLAPFFVGFSDNGDVDDVRVAGRSRPRPPWSRRSHRP